jgi:hypothetical protein
MNSIQNPPKTVILKPEKGTDGWYRVLIDIYWYFGSANSLRDLMIEQTNLKWETFGCFMDRCCLATQEDPGEIEFTYPWNEPLNNESK